MAFKMKPKKDLKRGAKESDSRKKDLEEGAKESDSMKTGPGGALPHVVDAERGKPGRIWSLMHKIAARMAAEKKVGVTGSGQESPQAVPPKGQEEKTADKGGAKPEKKSGVRDVSIADLMEDIARAGEALKKKDVKTAEALYWSITEIYNQFMSDPKCNVKAANVAYEKLISIYDGIIKLGGGKEGAVVFKPLNEAIASEKKETKDKALQPAAEDAKKLDSPKLLPPEQVIYTVIDSVIEIVDSRGEISLQELSKILCMPPEQMEELAKILDEHGILQLHYPSNPLAHPLLRSMSKHDLKRLGRQG